jgi:hypothetical protein
MLLLDIEKAYDTFWHDGLIYKMSPNYPLFLLKIVKSFLTGRTFALHYRGLQSRVHDIPARLPQIFFTKRRSPQYMPSSALKVCGSDV